MRTTRFRFGIVALAALTAAGCGSATGVEPPPEGISGPPPKRPNDDLMAPRAKKSSKGKIPRTPGAPPRIPRR